MNSAPQILSAAVLICVAAAGSARAADRINLALAANGAVASQSSDPFGMPASRGNDGAITADQNFAHTGNSDHEWWEVNLGAPRTIAEVRVWLRSDQIAGSRDSNLRLVIYSDAGHTTEVYSEPFDGTVIPLPYRNIRITPPAPVTGQIVRVEHPAGVADYLQINEVQVFNQAVNEVDLALSGTATMSSTYGNYYPGLAIDGVNVGTAGNGGTTSTAHSGGTENPLIPSWQVDLGAAQPISAVRVFTAADTAQTRNDDLAVVVLDSAFTVVRSNYNAVHPPVVTLPGHDFPANKQYLLYTFEPPISGQFVRVAHTTTAAQYLVLPEVEVLKAYAAVPEIHISQGPTNRTVDLNSSVSLSVKAGVWGANANYISYQWLSNGVDIAGANGASYTTPLLTALGDYTYGVKVLLPGATATTQAVITVFSDVVPPTVVSNSFSVRSSVMMTLNFSEVLDGATATNAAHYLFAGGATVSNPVLAASGKDVTFVVTGLLPCDDYVLNVSGVKDLAGNTMVATNLTGTMEPYRIDFALDGTATESSNPFGYGAGNAIDGDTGSLMHTSNGDNEWWEVDLGSARSIGEIALWFRGDCCGDRDGDLLISVLDNPTSRARVWVGVIGPALPLSLNPRTTNFVVAPPVMGQIVRVEHPVGVANYLDFAEVQVGPPAGGLCIVSDPASLSVVTNDPAWFSVQAQGPGPLRYQWRHNGSDLPGETGATLYLLQAGVAQAGLYSVVVANATRQRTSATAVLTLVPPATTYPIVKIDFKGSLNGATYALGPGEIDVTGTFGALAGTETINNGVAVLDSAAPGQGYAVTNNLVDGGSGVETNIIAEMLFTPAAGFEQGTLQTSGFADIFSFGSVYYSDINHSDGVFALRYSSPTNYQLRVNAVSVAGVVEGPEVPVAGVQNHVAIVYIQGPGQTNNLLHYYLNGNLISTMPLAKNVGSASAGSVVAAFGQAVPGSTFVPRGLQGLLDSLAYSTFSGVFSPAHNFIYYRPAPTLGISRPSNGKVTLTWEGSGYEVQENTSPSNAAGWTAIAGTSPLTVNLGPGTRYFRLHKQ